MNLTALARCLKDDFQLEGDLNELYSYQDASYLLTTASNDPNSHESQPTRYVVKVMHAHASATHVDLQINVLCALQELSNNARPDTATVVATRDGHYRSRYIDENAEHIVWVVSYLEGVLAADQQPYTSTTLRNLGKGIAHIHRDLATFDHEGLDSESNWSLTGADWIARHTEELCDAFPKQADWLNASIAAFIDDNPEGTGKAALLTLEQQAIHGDINEHNVLFSRPHLFRIEEEQQISGLIDFGDAHRAPRICDLAVACTYFMMHQENPWKALQSLVQGYHRELPLTPHEREFLMPLVRLRLAQSLTHSMLRSKESDDDYVTISQAPALKLIDQLSEFQPGFATYWVHHACGNNYLLEKKQRLNDALAKSPAAPVVEVSVASAKVLDLSPESGHPANPFSGDMPDPLLESTFTDTGIEDNVIPLGRYGEPRLVYQSPDFKASSHPASLARTIHAGVDVFLPAGAKVFAPCDAVVHAIENRTAKQDYGPVIVLRHQSGDDDHYTLYGHLDSECLNRLKVGDKVTKGDRIALIGSPKENGGWPPHLHFQWILEDLDWGTDVNGVCHRFTWPVWSQFFPNPAPLLGCDESLVSHAILDDETLGTCRRERLGEALSVSYTKPVQAVRGWQQYLYDQYGRCYLDAYNNVPHVGHCHPVVVEAVSRQLATLSTNTRYLHQNILDYADALTNRFDDNLDVCFLLNSASEANELALRLARTYTNARDLIVMQDAYHGHTTTLIDISPYKAEGNGGQGCPDWVHQVPAVDLYRGKYRYGQSDAGSLYALDAKEIIDKLDKPLCGFICESLPSVGGQLVYPQGYLSDVYGYVRDAGGVCIADEVQTGFGRTGDHFWGFEQQKVTPDMVILGKPIGNGFPLAALITTKKIARAFNNGMEFFSTFGGNTVACAAGLAVLDVVDSENVQAHVKEVGDYLIARLRDKVGSHPLVGDVRGMGLFLGVELVTNKDTQNPATAQASYIKNRLRHYGVLVGTDGPYDNVLKIRPPTPFNKDDADFLVDRLEHILNDTVLSMT